MSAVLLLLCAVLVRRTATFDCCKDDLCSPSLAKRKTSYIDNSIYVPDSVGGCRCKEHPGRYVKCFGRFDCRRIPPNMNLSLTELRVVTAAFTAVKRDDLARYSMLKKIDLENNNELRLIEEYSFAELGNLVNLSISYNHKLTHLMPKTFVGLDNLKELYLVNNGFVTVADIAEALVPKYLPGLYDLTLKENYFSVINDTEFAPMENSTVKKLNLAHCTIEIIDARSLVYFKHLEELRIGVNIFDVSTVTNLLIAMTEAVIPLKYLNLYKIGLRKTPRKELLEAVGNSSVECLSLAGNQFETITNDSFPPMNTLKLLDLRDVSAFDICPGAFDNLPNLRTLLLSDNKLSSVPQGARLNRLSFLDLIRNTESYLMPSYFTIDNDTFANMSNLNVLNLSFNRLTTIYESTFVGLEKLRYLSLKKCEIFTIGHRTFHVLKKLLFLDLEGNHFVLSKPNPLEKDLFEGLENLQVLLLGRNNISYLSESTFSSLKSLNHLSLNDNSLVRLDPSYFKALTNLKVVDLQRNHLIPWSRRLFTHQKHLVASLLSDNKFSSLTAHMLDDMVNLTTLDLRNNNFICDCEMLRTFKSWISGKSENSSVISAIEKSGALCFPNEKPMIEHLMAADNVRKCGRNYIPILATCAILFCFTVTVAILVYCYRWHLRYYWFLTKLHLIRKGKSDAEPGKKGYCNYEYDAFVSYSNEDSNFVARLVAMLENYDPFLRLCVYERDFEVGSIISESVLESVSKSRRILLIISDSYVRSQWCQWETHIAQHCQLFFKDDGPDSADDSLILVKLSAFNQKHLTPTLKYLLKTRIYLQWDDDESRQGEFWVRLRRNLAKGRSEVYTHL